ncbi:hypothetical protein ASG66_17830 [Bacillus sp. Leaf406]|nr:hypothetical protein ASG66_17830 [Bacillus sp. Leaf406]
MELLQKTLQRYPTDHMHTASCPITFTSSSVWVHHNPTDLIHYLHSVYARYFNQRYDYVGHLFKGRFYSKQIPNHKQLLDTSASIHINHVKANYTKISEDYLWSSYRAFSFPYSNQVNNHPHG